jgi:hypothetical protein
MMKDSVLWHFQQLASFRRRLAEKSQRDDLKRLKNESHAESIEMMIRYVETLPDSHPFFKELADACGGDSFGAGSGAYAVRFGERLRTLTFEECPAEFESWVRCAIEEAKDKTDDVQPVEE